MKGHGIFIILFLSAILFFVSSCGQDRDTTDDTVYDRDRGLDDPTIDDRTAIRGENKFWTTDREYTYAQRNEFRQDVNSALQRLDNKINELEKRAANTTKENRDWYNDRIEDLKDKRAEIQKDIQDFDNTKEDDWEDFKEDIASSWDDVENSWHQMARDERMEGEDRVY